MFQRISSNSCPLNLLFVRSHQAEILIIVKRLIQGRNNVTRVHFEPKLCDQGRHKNDALALSATLLTTLGPSMDPTIVIIYFIYLFICVKRKSAHRKRKKETLTHTHTHTQKKKKVYSHALIILKRQRSNNNNNNNNNKPGVTEGILGPCSPTSLLVPPQRENCAPQARIVPEKKKNRPGAIEVISGPVSRCNN